MDSKPHTKFQELTRSQKIEYIWEYYKIPIIIAVVALCIMGSVINTILNPPPTPYAQLALISMPMTTPAFNVLKTRLTDDLPFDKELNTIELIEINMMTSDPTTAYTSMQRFSVMVAAKELELIICSKDEFETLSQQEYFLDLSTALSDDDIKAYENIIIYSKDSEDITHPYGISLEGNGLFKEAGINVDDYCAGIVINTTRIDNAVATFNYIASWF